MKYIRTKESINPVERQEDIKLFEKTGQRLADTIEELCDEFVIVTKYNHFQIKKGSWLGDFFNPKYNYISYSNEIGPDSKEKIIGKYGAIWTDKGLIYVAKMNESGELELL